MAFDDDRASNRRLDARLPRGVAERVGGSCEVVATSGLARLEHHPGDVRTLGRPPPAGRKGSRSGAPRGHRGNAAVRFVATLARRAGREYHRDTFCLETARDEREDLSRGAIEPLLVVDHAEQWLLLCHVREEAQDRQGDREPVRRRLGTHAERRPQRVALGRRQLLEALQHRRQQLMQAGVGELHLRLDAGGAHHTAARRSVDQVLQQRGLAHARFAPQHQGPALTRANGVDEPVEQLQFVAPGLQLSGTGSHGSVSEHHENLFVILSPLRAGG